jgi:hypothetical protein
MWTDRGLRHYVLILKVRWLILIVIISSQAAQSYEHVTHRHHRELQLVVHPMHRICQQQTQVNAVFAPDTEHWCSSVAGPHTPRQESAWGPGIGLP